MLEWSQVYRQEPRKLKKICRQPMFLMELRTLLLLLLLSSSFLVTGFLSSLVLLLLSQWWTPPLRLQVSACSTFLVMCDVPSMAVFCKESIECCPGIVSRQLKTVTFCMIRRVTDCQESIISKLHFEYSTCRSRWSRGLMSGSWPLGYGDRGFETSSRQGCLSLCFCVCVCFWVVLSRVGWGPCDGLITRPKESYHVS
jgi:hypothetical protein